MTVRRRARLAARLAPHLPRRFDPTVYAWWPRTMPDRSRWRPGGRAAASRRHAQLAQVLDRLALLLGVGHDLRAAVDHVVAAGRGPVVAELAGVAGQLASGTPAAAAVRSWGRRAACPYVAQLAADLRRCVGADDVTTVVERHALRLQRAVVREQVRASRLRAAAVWVAAAVACAGTAIAIA